MYAKIADRITKFLYSIADTQDKNGIYKDPAVICYGIELLLSSVVNCTLILALGGLLGEISTVILFVTFFCPVRQYSGGYHAKSYLWCTLQFLALFLTIHYLVGFIDWRSILIVCFFMCSCFIVKVAPLDTINKQINHDLRKICKKKIKMIIAIEAFAVIIFEGINWTDGLHAATEALILESILLILGKVNSTVSS